MVIITCNDQAALLNYCTWQLDMVPNHVKCHGHGKILVLLKPWFSYISGDKKSTTQWHLKLGTQRDQTLIKNTIETNVLNVYVFIINWLNSMNNSLKIGVLQILFQHTIWKWGSNK
jgi:hypothetical protein